MAKCIIASLPLCLSASLPLSPSPSVEARRRVRIWHSPRSPNEMLNFSLTYRCLFLANAEVFPQITVHIPG
jgi:hypothetical protein